jgi:predicted acetyltransferase
MVAEVHTIEMSDVARWLASKHTGFLQPAPAGEAEFRGPELHLDRTWGAFDDGRVVGTLRSFPSPLTVPGGRTVAASALTSVTVASTHRRRGLLTEMIGRDLTDSAARGEAVSILIASEYPIYGRFGYGPAAEGATYTVDASRLRFLQPGVGSVEFVELSDLRGQAPRLYDLYRVGQPGAIERDEQWWDEHLHQVPVPGQDEPTGYQVLYRSPEGNVEGYLRYRARADGVHMRRSGVLDVQELLSVSPRAYQRLWQYCCEVDLVATVRAGDRAIDERLPWLLVDGRVVSQTGRWDFLWVRVLDVAATLSARRYLAEGRVVIEVTDPLGLASGRFVLDGGPDGAVCAGTSELPDLSVTVDALGSVSLGGVTLSTMADVGRAAEHRRGALARADAMFRGAVIPWCSTWF